MSLLKLQQQFRNILFQKEDASGVSLKKETNPLSSPFLLYQNNLYQGLYKTLCDKFKMTLSLLGEDDFFDLAKEYIFTTPQVSPYLCDYGQEFPVTIKNSVGRELAELEWKMNLSVLSYRSEAPLCFEDIINMDLRFISRCVFRFHSSVQLYSSAYALKEIWMAIKKGKPVPVYKNVSYFFISTENQQSSFFELTEEEYLFLKAIKEGQSLGSAYDAGLDINSFQKILKKFLPYLVEFQHSSF